MLNLPFKFIIFYHDGFVFLTVESYSEGYSPRGIIGIEPIGAYYGK
jgi:hypothetical protein